MWYTVNSIHAPILKDDTKTQGHSFFRVMLEAGSRSSTYK